MTLTGNWGPILVIGIFILQVFIDIYFQPTRDAEKWFWHVLCQNIFEVAFKFVKLKTKKEKLPFNSRYLYRQGGTSQVVGLIWWK